jgi:hypothetical protein
MTRNIKLNRKKPSGVLYGHPSAAYLQDGRYFNRKGEYVGDLPGYAPPAKPKTRPVVSAVDEADSKKAAILARAAKALEAYGGDDGAPDEIRDARKENAKAAAAENNA